MPVSGSIVPSRPDVPDRGRRRFTARSSPWLQRCSRCVIGGRFGAANDREGCQGVADDREGRRGDEKAAADRRYFRDC